MRLKQNLWIRTAQGIGIGGAAWLRKRIVRIGQGRGGKPIRAIRQTSPPNKAGCGFRSRKGT